MGEELTIGLFDLSFVFIIAALLVASFFKNRKATKQALKIGYKSFKNVASMFLAMFLLIGLFQVFLSSETIQRIMGKGVGGFAPFIGTILGGIGTGPPAVIYPVGQFLLSNQASVSAVVALITAWVAVGTVSLPAEIVVLCRRFAITSWALNLVFSILIGLATGVLVGLA
ncbi:MAG: hypothetical protein ACYC1U_08585 [Candidatus Aquicultorales bacterium]